MWASLLPGVRDLRAPLAAGYVWLSFGWLLFEPRQGSLGFMAPLVGTISSLDRLVPAAGLAVAASFAAYLIGSLSSTLTDAVLRGLSMRRPWVHQFEGVIPFRGPMERVKDRFSPFRYIRFVIHPEDIVGTRLPSPEGRIGVPRGAVPFAFMVQGWRNDLSAAAVEESSLRQAVSTELRGDPASKLEDWDVRDPRTGDWSWRSTIDFLLGALVEPSSPSTIDLLLGARVYSQRELIADGLLDEKSDMYGAVDRLRGEVELRDAMLFPLLALVILVSVTVSPVWLVAMGVIVGLALQRRDLDRRRTERLLAAVTWRPQRAPSLTRIERVVLGPVPPEKRSGAAAARPDQTPGLPHLESDLEA